VTPRVAVIIPTHDDAHVVAEAVDSVAGDEAVEVVVVDDGSTDPVALEALDVLRARGVTVLRQENAGPGAARMAGVRATSAPYVLPLDADDLLLPGAAMDLADALDAHPEAGVAWGDYELFGDFDGRYRAPSRWLPWSLTYVNQYPIVSLVRREALLRAGGWPDKEYEDWSLWLRFVELGIGGVNAGRLVYRRRLLAGGKTGAGYRRRHQQLYGELKRRHARLFADRPALRAAEKPPAWKVLAYPILFGRRAVIPFRLEWWMQRTMMQRGLRLSR
jgi:glycosyltransferase involved in cell wall biosynthesis